MIMRSDVLDPITTSSPRSTKSEEIMNRPLFCLVSFFSTAAMAAPIQGTMSQTQSDVCLLRKNGGTGAQWGYFCGYTYNEVGKVTCNGDGTCSGSNHFNGMQTAPRPVDDRDIRHFSASSTNNALSNTTREWLHAPPGSTVDIGTCDVPGSSGSGDTYIRLFDSEGVQVAVNDDGTGCGYLSKLSYVVPDFSNGLYEIRAGCYGSSSCSGMVAYEVESPWTQWIDYDNQSGSGDYETIAALVSSGWLDGSCAEPIDIECQTTSGQDWQYARDAYHCSTGSGGYCVNSEQAGGYCEDYRVRFICP